MDQLRALSVRQPWAHSIVHLGKDIENRTRRLGHRGWTLIHASAEVSHREVETAAEFHDRQGLPELPTASSLRGGGIIGLVEIVDAVSADDPRASSPWWMGPYGLVLGQRRPLPFIPCKGTVAPLFWRPDAETLARVREALRGLPIPELST